MNPFVVLLISAVIAAQLLPPLLLRQWSSVFSTVPPMAVGVVFALWIMFVVALGPEGVSEFIYFQF